jgi:hypothetical protein
MEEKYKGTKIYQEVYWELIQASRYRGYITYQEIALMMGLPLSGNYMGKEVGYILGEISQDEYQRGRPMLSAVAIGSSGNPGGGFYKLAKDLGCHFEDTTEDKRTFWNDEKKKVYQTWQRELKD